MIRELDDVIRTGNLPGQGLTRGDIGAVVLIHQKGEGFEVEFATLDGGTMAIAALLRNQVRPAHPREIVHVCELAVR